MTWINEKLHRHMHTVIVELQSQNTELPVCHNHGTVVALGVLKITGDRAALHRDEKTGLFDLGLAGRCAG